MRIYIEDGRQSFYQWDKDQRVKLEGVDLDHYVHFGRPDGGAYEVKIYKDGSWFYANVPNLWLQLNGSMKVYIVNGDKQTEHRASMFIKEREKPDGYLYTETEVLSYVSLDERLRHLEGDGLADAVAAYLEENPIEAGATEEQAAQIQANADAIEELQKQNPDWNAAEGEPGHILNRTHWKETVKDADTFPETLLPNDENGEWDNMEWACFMNLSAPLVSGKEYTILYNGEEFRATAETDTAGVITDGGVKLSFEHGQIFYQESGCLLDDRYNAVYYPNEDGYQENADDSTLMDMIPITLGITSYSEVIHKIPEEYLPDTGGNVAYDSAQELTEEQKAQARENIGAQVAGDYLESDELTEAVNTALAQAKASGEFDGADGTDGVSATHEWNGTVLTVTSASGTSSADLKGEQGEPGADYVLTDADKTEIAEMASELVEVPESSGGGIAVTGATVGQTVKIAKVDDNGVPTAWEPVDFPSGEGGVTPTEAEKIIDYTADADGATATSFNFTVEAYPKLAEYNRLRGIFKRNANTAMAYIYVKLNSNVTIARIPGGQGMAGFDIIRHRDYWIGLGPSMANISLYNNWKNDYSFPYGGASTLTPQYLPELESVGVSTYTTFLDEGATIEIWGWNE